MGSLRDGSGRVLDVGARDYPSALFKADGPRITRLHPTRFRRATSRLISILTQRELRRCSRIQMRSTTESLSAHRFVSHIRARQGRETISGVTASSESTPPSPRTGTSPRDRLF